MIINGHLVKAIVDIALFLEYTNSELLDEDSAVEAMEQLAAELQQMAEGDQQQLAKQIIGFASSYEPPQSEFVANLPEALGLA
jgi:hypothetical protein